MRTYCPHNHARATWVPAMMVAVCDDCAAFLDPDRPWVVINPAPRDIVPPTRTGA